MPYNLHYASCIRTYPHILIRADNSCMRLFMPHANFYKLHYAPCIHTYPHIFIIGIIVLLGFANPPIMQLSFIHPNLLCLLLLPALAMTAVAPVSRPTRLGIGQLNLVNSQHVNITNPLRLPTRLSYCKHDDPYPPWDPPYKSSLNYTFPETPDISQAFLDSVGIRRGKGNYPFDCFIEIPGGVVVFEVC